MNAYVLHGIGDLRLEEVKQPGVKPGEVLVAVKAVGVCGSDIPRIYQVGAHSYPLIPGHECSGIVVDAGERTEEGWKGKRVGVFPLIPCKVCGPCREKQFEMCRNYSYIGSRRDGGFAEYLAVPKWNLIELPDNVSYETAAMLEPMAVAVHAMRRAALTPEATVAVYGLGTIGVLLSMFLEDAGVNHLLVIGNKDLQRRTILDMGIGEGNYLDIRESNALEWIMEKTNHRGVDVLFECIGKNESVSAAIAATAPGGRIQLVGNPVSDMKFNRATYWKILRNQLIISGSWNSSFSHCVEDDWGYVLQRLVQGRICPEKYITHNLSLVELEDGLRIMKDKTEEYIKVMATVP